MNSIISEDDFVPQEKKLPVTFLLSQANSYLHLSRLCKAIETYELILNSDPNNFKALLGRAKCYLRLGKYEKAEEDFGRASLENSKSTEAIYLKGLAEYFRGDFEKSLITHWEGSKKSPNSHELRRGYQFREFVIKESLGDSTLHEKDIRKMNLSELHRDEKKELKYDPKGVFSKDLIVLDNILKDKSLSSIHESSKDAFQFLMSRQRFAKMVSPGLSKQRKSQRLKNKGSQSAIMNRLHLKVSKLRQSLEEGETEAVIKKGKETLQGIRKLSNDKFSEKTDTECLILHFLGLAYMVEEKKALAVDSFEKQLTISRKNRSTSAKCRALRDLGEIYMKYQQYSKAFSYFQQSSACAGPKDQTILLYKLSDCASRLNNFEYAKTTAKELLKQAVDANDNRFQLDLLLLLGEIDVKRKNLNAAQVCYEEALRTAQKSHDPRAKKLENLLHIFNEAVSRKIANKNDRFKIVNLSQELKCM